MAWPVAARCWGTAAPMRRIQARCRSANVIPCRGCTIASAPGLVEDAITIHRRIAAMDAIAAAPPGPSASTNRGPIRMKTMTSATTASDHRTLIMVGLMPAAFHRMTANASCMAWLPKTRAAMSTMRRNTTIPMSSLMALKDDGSGAASVLLSGAGNSMVLAAAPRSRTPCIHAIDVSAVQPITWPATSVPNTKAADAEPRTQPYSKLIPGERAISKHLTPGRRQATWLV